MDIQSVPKVGISSVVHSKHIDADNIDVVDNDIALFDTESVISLYNGPTKLEVLTVGSLFVVKVPSSKVHHLDGWADSEQERRRK